MTRETKIGLLVGLMFIIVIGVLLSDHLTSATRPDMANLAGAGQTAFRGLQTPGGGNVHLSTELTPPDIAPSATVLAPGEAPRPADAGSASVTVGARPGVSPLEVTETAIRTPFPDAASTLTLDPSTPRPGASGNPISPVPAPGPAPDTGSLRTVGVPAPVPVPAPANREYKAVAGDTLSKIASRVYGRNTKETRDLIQNANASLKSAPDRIVVGKVYVIPSLPETAAPAPAAAPAAASATEPAPAAAPRYYVVKPNDNLWRIATQQCGDARAVDAIVKANSDVLKSKTQQLKVGMKLRLPEKTN
jgi:nucleoid-associated protein YgaU